MMSSLTRTHACSLTSAATVAAVGDGDSDVDDDVAFAGPGVAVGDLFFEGRDECCCFSFVGDDGGDGDGELIVKRL